MPLRGGAHLVLVMCCKVRGLGDRILQTAKYISYINISLGMKLRTILNEITEFVAVDIIYITHILEIEYYNY